MLLWFFAIAMFLFVWSYDMSFWLILWYDLIAIHFVWLPDYYLKVEILFDYYMIRLIWICFVDMILFLCPSLRTIHGGTMGVLVMAPLAWHFLGRCDWSLAFPFVWYICVHWPISYICDQSWAGICILFDSWSVWMHPRLCLLWLGSDWLYVPCTPFTSGT